MGQQLTKRYIFADYESLKKVKFSKLQKVCYKVFILIDSKEENIPFHIVLQAQKLGKRVKWISIEGGSHSFPLHLSFLIGALHQKVGREVEFAILSDDEGFDPLIDFVNDAGRNCIRVKTKKSKKTKIEIEDQIPSDILNDDYFKEVEEEDDLSEAIKNLNSGN